MQQLNKNNFSALLQGSLFFGTGGGGNPQQAQEIYNALARTEKNIQLKTLNECADDDTIITSFGIGNITATMDHSSSVRVALAALEKELGKKIAGIVPVEIGPKSVAMCVELASALNLPIIDADIVGGRSTPDVFLETITLFDIPRTPLAVADDAGNCEVLVEKSSPEQEEQFLRDFAARAGGIASVVGYPMHASQMKRSCSAGTVSRAIEAGEAILKGKLMQYISTRSGKELFRGRIESIEDIPKEGFTIRNVNIRGGVGSANNTDTLARVFIKNENLICWVNEEVVLTCPDLIILLDVEQKPLYNTDLAQNQEVIVIGFPATDLWRTPEGLRLFDPSYFTPSEQRIL